MTLLEDSYGAPTTAPVSALSAINDFVEGFVGYQPRAVRPLEVVDEYPECALLNIQAGFLWMFLERPEAPGKAMPFLERARSLKGLNHREQGLLALLDAWIQYDRQGVIRIGEQVLKAYPQDLSTLKLVQYHAFNDGDAATMLRLAKSCESANADRAPVHSMIAFGHEQLHDLDAAEAAAQRALVLDEAEPWAHHALAHIHLGRSTTRDGLAFLLDRAPHWKGLNSFMFTHNWWHVALFEIAEGDVDQALKLYDERCWGVQPDYSQDQINAISLLARLECAGVSVGNRWQALKPYVETRADDVIQPFLSLQYLYALARSKSEQADVLFERIRGQAESPEVEQDKALWQAVGIPAATGVLAHARGEFHTAATQLSQVRSRLVEIGGSHAQRDLFDQLLLDALWQSEQWEAAERQLAGRLRYEPHNPVIRTRLEAVQSRVSGR